MRKTHKWNVTIAIPGSGDQQVIEASTFWDPEAPDAAEAIRNAVQSFVRVEQIHSSQAPSAIATGAVLAAA